MKAARSRSEELEAVPDADWPDAAKDMEETLVEASASLDELVAGLRMVLPE
jgi:hypothetical protein